MVNPASTKLDATRLKNLGFSNWFINVLTSFDRSSTPKIISSTTYTLKSTDINNIYTNAAGCEVTVPSGLSLSHSSHHTSIANADVTFVAGDNVTINNYADHNASAGQYAPATLFQSSQNVFILGGNTKTV